MTVSADPAPRCSCAPRAVRFCNLSAALPLPLIHTDPPADLPRPSPASLILAALILLAYCVAPHSFILLSVIILILRALRAVCALVFLAFYKSL